MHLLGLGGTCHGRVTGACWQPALSINHCWGCKLGLAIGLPQRVGENLIQTEMVGLEFPDEDL